MEITKKVKLLAAGLLLTSSSIVHAGFFDIVGGSLTSIPTGTASNELVMPIYGTSTRSGYLGANVKVSDTSYAGKLRISFLGFEAGYINEFDYAGSTLFTTTGGVDTSPGLPDALVTLATITGDYLDFAFNTNVTGLFTDPTSSVANGSNPATSGTGAPNFFVTCDGSPTATSCNSLVIFLDDGGAGPDDNHDDMAIRIQVPEPATIALLGIGLLGMGFLRRKS